MNPEVPIDTVFTKTMSKTTVVIFVVADTVFIRLRSISRLLLKSPVLPASASGLGSSKNSFLLFFELSFIVQFLFLNLSYTVSNNPTQINRAHNVILSKIVNFDSSFYKLTHTFFYPIFPQTPVKC
jgi:hypothetical protein